MATSMNDYNPYQPSPMATPEVEKLPVPSLRGSSRGLAGSSNNQHNRAPPPASRNLYWRLSDLFGFKEKPSLALFFIMGGALLGFCLSRLMMFSPAITEKTTVPGEWFWYRQKLFKPNIFVHIYLTTLGALFSGMQFIPKIRQRYLILHRMNGYLVILLLLPAMVTGAIVGRRAFGGELHTQAAFFTLAIVISFSLLNGWVNVKIKKDIQAHRRWMLRAMTYLASVITARIIAHIAIEIITVIGTYYSIWTCDEIEFVVDSGDFGIQYPECTQPYVRTFVKASTKADKINEGSAIRCTFGMALWLGLLIHAAGVELYIWYAEAAAQAHQSGFVYSNNGSEGEERKNGNRA